MNDNVSLSDGMEPTSDFWKRCREFINLISSSANTEAHNCDVAEVQADSPDDGSA